MSYIGFSDDQGTSWTQMDIPGTVETALEGRDELMGLVVDPTSSNVVYASGISQLGPFPNSVGATDFMSHSFRGDTTRARGLTGNVSNQWDHLTHATGNALMPNGGTAGTSAGHADSRAMTFDANGNLIEVADGGLVRRTNPGNNTGDWFSINGNIQVAEVHSIAYDTNFNIIIGGTQDTGTPEQTAPGSLTWNSLATADGGKVAVDDSVAGTSICAVTPSRIWEASPGAPAIPVAPMSFLPLTGRGPAQFYTPLEVNVNNPARLLLGTVGGLSESTDQGNTASIVPGSAVTANSRCRHGVWPCEQRRPYLCRCWNAGVRAHHGRWQLGANPGTFPGGTVFGVAVDPANREHRICHW